MGSWDISTYGGGDVLLHLFSGLVALLGDNNFLVLLKLTSLITVLWVIIEALFMKRPLSIQPFLVVILVFYILFIPRVNVIITDRIDPSNSGVVANVPIGLGFTASMASTTGDWMSRAFETVFTLPNELQYSTNGLLFGSNLLRAASQFEITDSRLAANVSEFMQQCVFYDILTGFYTWGDIVNEPDLWGMLQSTANPARSFQYQDTSGSKSILTCPAGAALLNTDWGNEMTQAQAVYGGRMFPGDPLAQAKFMAALPVSYAYMSNISTTAADSIRQNMMANVVKRSLTRFAARADAGAAAQDLALAQAEAQRRTSYSVLGELAGETLPLLRNVFEVLIYGMFPFFLILMFTPAAGKALMFYLKSLFWLQLWAPLYALLNLIMVSYSANTGTAVATLATGGQELTLATTTALGAVNADIASIASYMAWMIPLISWGVVNAGAGMSMSMLASGLGAITQQAGARAAADVSHGNVSMGNIGMYNQSAFKNDFAPSYASGGTMVDTQGTTHTLTHAGGDFENYQKHSLGASSTITSAMKSGTQTQASEMMAATRNEFAEHGSMVQASNQKIDSFMSQANSSVSTSDSWRSDEMASAQKEYSEAQRLQTQFGESRGYNSNQSAGMLGMATLVAHEPKLISMVSPVGLNAQLGLEGKSSTQISQDFKEAVQFVKDNNYGEQWRETESAVNSVAAQVSQATNDSSAKGVTSAINDQTSHADRLQASIQKSQSWQQAASRMNEEGFTFSADTSGAMLQFMRSRHDDHHVSEMIAQHNQGDMQGTQFIAGEAAEFAKTFGVELAGVKESPSADGVTSTGQRYMSEVGDQSDEITDVARNNGSTVRQMTSRSGIQSDAQINSDALNLAVETDQQFLDVGAKVDKGKAGATTEGQVIRDKTEHQTDPENSTLLVDAIGDGVERVLPSERQREGIKDKGKKLINDFFD